MYTVFVSILFHTLLFIQCLSTEEGAVLRKRFNVKLLLVLTNILKILMK